MFIALGRLGHRHRRAVGVGWLVLMLVGFVAGGLAFPRLSDPGGAASLESIKGFIVLDDHATVGPRLYGLVDRVDARDPAVGAAVHEAAQQISRLPHVQDAHDAYVTTPPVPQLVASDGRATLVVVDLDKGLSVQQQDAAVAATRRALDAVSGAVPGATARVGGNPMLRQESNAQVGKDLKSAEVYTLPLAAVVLVLVFGGLVAAALPLVAAVVSIAGGLLIVFGFTYLWQLSPQVPEVVSIMGVGLAIDYGLLIVNRYREERASGLPVGEAIERTTDTAGRAITFSALTVMASLSGLFLFDEPTYRSMGAGGVAVVLVALLAGLTLVPALLAMAGDRVTGGHRRRHTPARVSRVLDRLAAPPPEEGVFSRLTRRSQRHPVLVIVAVVAVLVAAGLPFLGAHFKTNELNATPASFESRQVADALATRFSVGGSGQPVQVVMLAPATDPRVTAYAEHAGHLPGVRHAEVSAYGPDVSELSLDVAGDPQGPAGTGLVHTLRADRPPVTSYVTGMPAVLVDFNHQVAVGLPKALGFIAVATFVLLFLMTGSVVLPLKALAMNVLSLSASFGALVWVFQDGHLSGLLGFTSTGALETWVPVIVFTFAFGLSMDYEVFLISRIKELHDRGADNDEAVAGGLQRSGRIITSAALLIVIVFCGFVAGKVLGIKELGVAMTLAVVVDATLVRCLLVPATMTLLGEWNWWAPGRLRRLHTRFGLVEAVPAAPGVPAQGAPADVSSHTR